MTHPEIEEKEIIERYVLHQLTPEERLAFQEHYFSCDQCFEQAQIEARFIASVRDASATGVLSDTQTRAFETGRASFSTWLKPAFAFAAIAVVALTLTIGWLVFKQIPGLRQQIARERDARERIERESNDVANKTDEELKNERQKLENERRERETLQAQLDELASNRTSRINVPTVVLEAVRNSGEKANQLSLPAIADRALFRVDIEPGNPFIKYDLQILDSSKRVVETITGAKSNSHGALVVNVPARSLLSGKYVVRLYGVGRDQRELLGEYDLQVRRQ